MMIVMIGMIIFSPWYVDNLESLHDVNGEDIDADDLFVDDDFDDDDDNYDDDYLEMLTILSLHDVNADDLLDDDFDDDSDNIFTLRCWQSWVFAAKSGKHRQPRPMRAQLYIW